MSWKGLTIETNAVYPASIACPESVEGSIVGRPDLSKVNLLAYE
jgi:hypothetical protein